MSVIWLPIDRTGLSEVIGSWNTMETRSPRSARSAAGLSARRSMSPKWILPLLSTAFSGISPIIASASVDLPEPLSPTKPTTLPRGILKSMLRSAWTDPAGVRNSTLRPRTSITLSSACDCGSAAIAMSEIPAQPRIQQIAQGFAEEGEAQGRHDQRNTACDHDPGCIADIVETVKQDASPARRRRRDTHAEIGKTRL